MIVKFAKLLRVTGVKTGVGVLIFGVNRSRIGVGFCNFGAGLERSLKKATPDIPGRAHTPVCYYRFYIFNFLAYEVSCLVTLKSRLALEAMMSRLGLRRFGPRSSSDHLPTSQFKHFLSVENNHSVAPHSNQFLKYVC